MENALRRLDGVDQVDISLQTNRVELKLRPGHTLRLRDVPQAIREAGFTPSTMHIWTEGLEPAWELPTALPSGSPARRFRVETEGFVDD